METVLVQIKNNKAYKLLEDLEDLHIPLNSQQDL